MHIINEALHHKKGQVLFQIINNFCISTNFFYGYRKAVQQLELRMKG